MHSSSRPDLLEWEGFQLNCWVVLSEESFSQSDSITEYKLWRYKNQGFRKLVLRLVLARKRESIYFSEILTFQQNKFVLSGWKMRLLYIFMWPKFSCNIFTDIRTIYFSPPLYNISLVTVNFLAQLTFFPIRCAKFRNELRIWTIFWHTRWASENLWL